MSLLRCTVWDERQWKSLATLGDSSTGEGPLVEAEVEVFRRRLARVGA